MDPSSSSSGVKLEPGVRVTSVRRTKRDAARAAEQLRDLEADLDALDLGDANAELGDDEPADLGDFDIDDAFEDAILSSASTDGESESERESESEPESESERESDDAGDDERRRKLALESENERFEEQRMRDAYEKLIEKLRMSNSNLNSNSNADKFDPPPSPPINDAPSLAQAQAQAQAHAQALALEERDRLAAAACVQRAADAVRQWSSAPRMRMPNRNDERERALNDASRRWNASAAAGVHAHAFVAHTSTLRLHAFWHYLGISVPHWSADVQRELARTSGGTRVDQEAWDFCALAHAQPPLAVLVALFWLQNTQHFADIRLWHIAQNVALGVRFRALVRACQLCDESSSAWPQLLAWFASQGEVAFPANRTPSSSGALEPGHADAGADARADAGLPSVREDVVRMALDATLLLSPQRRTSGPDSISHPSVRVRVGAGESRIAFSDRFRAMRRAEVERAAADVLWCVEARARECAAQRVGSEAAVPVYGETGVPMALFGKRHARVVLADTLALHWLVECAPSAKGTTAARARMIRARVEWLRWFLRDGCACAR